MSPVFKHISIVVLLLMCSEARAQTYVYAATAIAGTSNQGYADDQGPYAGFNVGGGQIAAYPDSNILYVADRNNHRIRQIDISTGEVTTIAGNGTSMDSDGDGTDAAFVTPTGLALDTVRNVLYSSDFSQQTVRQISLTSPYEVSTIYTGAVGSSSLRAMTIDPACEYLYVTDCTSSTTQLVIIDLSNYSYTTVDFTMGQPNDGSTYGAVWSNTTMQGTNTPYLFLGFVTDILAFDVVNQGQPEVFYSGFDHVGGLTIDSNGTLYVSDEGAGSFCSLSNNGTEMTVIASGFGSNTLGYSPTLFSSDYFYTPASAFYHNGSFYMFENGALFFEVSFVETPVAPVLSLHQSILSWTWIQHGLLDYFEVSYLCDNFKGNLSQVTVYSQNVTEFIDEVVAFYSALNSTDNVLYVNFTVTAVDQLGLISAPSNTVSEKIILSISTSTASTVSTTSTTSATTSGTSSTSTSTTTSTSANPATTSNSTSTSTSTSVSGNSGALGLVAEAEAELSESAKIAIGVVVPIVVIFIVICCLIFGCRRRRKNRIENVKKVALLQQVDAA